MSLSTVRSRLLHAAFIVFALNLGLTGVCGAEDDFDLGLPKSGEMPCWMKKSDEFMFDRKMKDDDDCKASEKPRTGPGYDMPGNEPEVDQAPAPRPPARETLREARESFSRSMDRERQALRTEASSALSQCHNSLRYSNDWSLTSPTPECQRAIKARNNCKDYREAFNGLQNKYMTQWPGQWVPIPVFLCPEVFDGLQHPNELMRDALARRPANPTPENNIGSGGQPPKKAPTTAEVMDYVQKSAADCLRRFPGGAPGNLTPEQAACVQEKTNAYQNGAR